MNSDAGTLVQAVCLECMGKGGWTGPVPVRLPTGRDDRRWGDCRECGGKGWRPTTIRGGDGG